MHDDVVVAGLFAVSWTFRPDEPRAAETLSFVWWPAVGLGRATGWLRGDLVNRLGVSVHDGTQRQGDVPARPRLGQRHPWDHRRRACEPAGA